MTPLETKRRIVCATFVVRLLTSSPPVDFSQLMEKSGIDVPDLAAALDGLYEKGLLTIGERDGVPTYSLGRSS